MQHYPDDVSQTFLRLRKKLLTATGKAISAYNMIEKGDRILVCMSGGKDSHALLMLLLALQERAPVDFELMAMNLDQKQPGFPEEILPAYLEKLGVTYRIVEADTYSIVKSKIPPGKTTCSLCSRLRRGIIYRTARELGMNKIALGHHRDDVVETLFLNMFFTANLKAMPPKLSTREHEFVVIRPLVFCAEKDIAAYARGMRFPVIPCNLCGTQENLQRQNIKAMLQQWESQYPGRTEKIFRAITNVTPSHLADATLFDFQQLGGEAQEADPLLEDWVGVSPAVTGSPEATIPLHDVVQRFHA